MNYNLSKQLMNRLDTFNSFINILDEHIATGEHISSAILCKKLIIERKLVFWGYDVIKIMEDGTVALSSNDLTSPLFFMLFVKNESDIMLWIVNRTIKNFTYSKRNISQYII